MDIEPTGLVHLTLRVTDVAQSTEFYAKAMDFDVQRERPGFAVMNT